MLEIDNKTMHVVRFDEVQKDDVVVILGVIARVSQTIPDKYHAGYSSAFFEYDDHKKASTTMCTFKNDMRVMVYRP